MQTSAAPTPLTQENGKPSGRGAATRARILDAAQGLFARKGYEGTTLRDIAGAVGLSNPSLYNHFDGKASLYAAVLERGIRPVLRIVTEAVEASDSANAAPEILRVTMQALGERPEIALLVQHEVLAGGEQLTPMLRAYLAPALAAGGELAGRRVAAAGWEPADVPHVLLTMVQAVLGFFTMAPLARQLFGHDLLDAASRERQTRFLTELSERLFTPRAAGEG